MFGKFKDTIKSFLPLLLLFNSSLSSAEEIKLSALIRLSGEFAMVGNAIREGMEIAVTESKEDLASQNISISLNFEDTRYPSNEIVSIAHLVSSQDKIKGTIVSTYPEIKPIASILEKTHLPGIVLWDATPEMDNLGEYTFGIGPWAPDTGQKVARFALNDLCAKKAFIISQQDDWSLEVSQTFVERFKLGGEIISNVVLNPNDTDFNSLLLKVKRSKPEVVYAPIAHNINAFVKQYKNYLKNVPLIMSDGVTDQLIALDPKSYEGIYSSATSDPDQESSKKFIELYRNKYGKAPGLLIFSACGYDSVKMYIEAIKSGARTREEIKDAL